MATGGCQLQLVWARVDDGDTSPIILLLTFLRYKDYIRYTRISNRA